MFIFCCSSTGASSHPQDVLVQVAQDLLALTQSSNFEGQCSNFGRRSRCNTGPGLALLASPSLKVEDSDYAMKWFNVRAVMIDKTSVAAGIVAIAKQLSYIIAILLSLLPVKKIKGLWLEAVQWVLKKGRAFRFTRAKLRLLQQ
ncbi:hypothetical protein C1H46_023315 [Malus baccata]|uniref:Uncharacterized protein n=1 Tax=Malus baccata TaxID=106549 RepID=A0A540LX49_MALBA|nr:hypothetical protein C1H46_023315 [Malus baccata]